MSDFVCSFCKAAPKVGGFTRKFKWKTQKGFDGHRCYKDEPEPKPVETREDAQKRHMDAWEKDAKRSVGDLIHFVLYRVIEPTHVQRGSRFVRVRYEEKIRFYYGEGIIKSLYADFSGLRGYFVDGYGIVEERNIYANKASAQNAVITLQKNHDEALKYAEMCR